ncbi:MAG: preprotein translocase subunit SecA [Segetibacter sp.]|nr:preprotein translocase subunit SecA [Segetibacter sp.]
MSAVLNLLKQDEELLGFYLGDGITFFGWELFYTLGTHDLRLLVDFCKDLSDDYVIRTEIIEALKQIALHQPERRLEMESYLRELLVYVSTITMDIDIYIDDVADKVIETIGQLQLSRLFPEVKRLFEEDKLPSFSKDIGKILKKNMF